MWQYTIKVVLFMVALSGYDGVISVVASILLRIVFLFFLEIQKLEYGDKGCLWI